MTPVAWRNQNHDFDAVVAIWFLQKVLDVQEYESCRRIFSLSLIGAG